MTMTKRLRVIAAIPNYNMADSLRQLLPSLKLQGYDQIYVLDDASTDNSRDVASELGAVFVSSSINKGAGGARNNVLKALAGEDLAETLIHFIDADITLATPNTPEVAQRLFADRDQIGFIGGLIKDNAGKQAAWNFGPQQSLITVIAATGNSLISRIASPLPGLAKFIHHYHLWPFLRLYPFTLEPPVRRPVYWTLEGNLFIMADRLKELGGFDETIREHDIQPLAMAAQKAGYVNYFDPAVAVIHHEGNVRSYNRDIRRIKVEWYLARKNGLSRWLTGGLNCNK